MGHEGCASVMGEPCPFTWRTLKTSFVSCVWDLVFDPRVEAIHSLAKSISTSLLGVKKGTRASQRTPGQNCLSNFQFKVSPLLVYVCLVSLCLLMCFLFQYWDLSPGTHIYCAIWTFYPWATQPQAPDFTIYIHRLDFSLTRKEFPLCWVSHRILSETEVWDSGPGNYPHLKWSFA